jgi:type I restriction enzyme, S subunit
VIFPSHLNGLVSPDYAVFDPISDVNVEYLGELFRSRKMRAIFRSESKGLGTGSSGFLRLYNDRFGAIHIPLPPSSEQNAILKGLDEQTMELSSAIRRTELEIKLISEYRIRLTADVVTGRLDVRNAASKLPKDVPKQELATELDEISELESEEVAA